MAASGHCYVEWKEQFVSKERGNRVVHYFLKDASGESVLAVVGTERSVRHMFYVVSEEFLNVHGAENSAHSGFRWRSRREVVNWLTSMLSQQNKHESPNDDLMPGYSSQHNHIPENKGRLTRSLKGHALDISWSGISWICGKQLKHYPAFCRNGIKIVIQSFVFVMAEKENRYLAYLEDMYEDRKGQKKVKVRWFHHNREVKGVVTLRNPHPKEVFITPYAQSISAECVDGPAIILTREHYDKCRAVFPHDVLARLHFCSQQFKNNRVKPFKLSKLRGYLDQPVFSCFGPDFFDDEEFNLDDVKLGPKRSRSFREQNLNYSWLNRRGIAGRHVDSIPCHTPLFKVNEKIELLCQDSGIRGCWFRCTVIQVSQRQIKVLYDDVKDEDGCGNLEEWVPAFRVAMPDKLGIRFLGRPTIRPALAELPEAEFVFEVGTAVDAWWNDGWWEGVLIHIGNSEEEKHQVYIPSENLYLNMERQKLRVSRDWVGEQWMDIEPKPNVLSSISAATSADTKHSICPSTMKKAGLNEMPLLCDEGLITCKVRVEEDKLDLAACMVLANGFSKNSDWVNYEPQQRTVGKNNEESNGNCVDDSEKDDSANSLDNDSDINSPKNDDNIVDEDINMHKLDGFETAGQKCEAELMEVDK